MALWLETDTNANTNISSATAVGVYTATGDVFVLPQILADQVAGGGDYVYYVTLQVAGAGSHYLIGPKTTHTAAAGETALAAQGGLIFLRNGDVLTVYIDGLAGDTTTPDVTVRFAAIPLPSAAAGAAGGVPVLDANLAASANVTYLKGSTTPVDNLVLAIETGGTIRANLVAILGTALTETAGQIAAAFKKMFNVSSPTGSVNSLPNAVPGASGGLALAGADGDTLETLSDQLDVIQAITDAIDVSEVEAVVSNDAGSLTIKKYVTFTAPVSGLVIPADWIGVIWTVKENLRDDDEDAICQVIANNPSGSDGLRYLNGLSPSDLALSETDGSLSVDQPEGEIVLALSAAATSVMDVCSGAVWNLKVLLPSDANSELATGTANIVYSVTRSLE